MEQSSVEDGFDSMNNLDYVFANNCIPPSSPSDETATFTQYEYQNLESYYDLDVEDINIPLYPDQVFNDLLNELPETDQFSEILPSPIMDDLTLLIGSREDSHSTESNDIADTIQSSDVQLAMIKSNVSTLPVTSSQVEKVQTKNVHDQSILLSQSVAVTDPTPNKLQITHALEESYRARYKSDYFPSKGACRHPRYVADSVGNHFISLQMPTKYSRNIRNEHIRVALLTTAMGTRGHFYSPYKFQTNHENVTIPDQNPIYLHVKDFLEDDGTMKLRLVLIKSKLDQLNEAQPLKPFLDDMNAIQNIISTTKVSPKDLINEYQLDKSHIAFTLCTKSLHGTYEIHTETTVISTVLTEIPTKPSAAATTAASTSGTTATTSKKKPEATTVNQGKAISCPNCSHCFIPTEADFTQKGAKRKSNNDTSNSKSKKTTTNRSTKKSKS